MSTFVRTRISCFTESTGRLTFFVLDCADCGVIFAATASYRAGPRYADGKSFICPNGHANAWSGTEADRPRQPVELLQQVT
jgi:hypothetical protein